MNFYQLSQYLQKLENTTKRLEMIDILTSLINDLSPEETPTAIYLISGYLKAPFESQKFNIADKMMLRVLAEAYSTPQKIYTVVELNEQYKKLGDLGTLALELSQQNKPDDSSLIEIHEKLIEVAKSEGSGSQDTKVKKLSKILKSADGLSAKYIVRIVLGTTRLGFTETTVLEALANYLGDRKLKKTIEATYNIHPDIGLIARKIKEKGLKGLDDISMETGVPILSQKPQRASGFMLEVMDRIDSVWAEFKLDGTRVQLHMDSNKLQRSTDTTQTGLLDSKEDKSYIKTYTRNLEETTHQYPDIIKGANEQIDAVSVILDGEAIGYNKETGEFLPFQETMQRKRKHDVAEMAKSIPLRYYAFDLLYLNGEPMIQKSLYERRKALKKIIKPGETIVVDDHLETKKLEELENYFVIAKERGLEGLIAKNPSDPYQAGARSYSWIKLKAADEKLLEDSVDCVVLGYYAGKGARAQFGIGGFLVGVYDKKTDTFKTVSKIGTGLKEDDWTKIKKMADKVKIPEMPNNVDTDDKFLPDVITSPSIVVEIGADEISKSSDHSAGYALRFPRLLKFREDKNPQEATTVKEIKKMFEEQREALKGKK